MPLPPLSLPNLSLSSIIQRFGVQGFTFTSGSGSVTVPSGAFWVIIKLWGGGGGGGGYDITNNWPGSGGGGGAFVAQWGIVSPGNTIAYSVGSGGGGGSDRDVAQGQQLDAGSSGGDTTVTTFGLVAGGGAGGAAGFPGSTASGGTASGGLINTNGAGGFAPEEPAGAGGIGGSAISAGSFWYDGGQLAAGAGGEGSGAGGASSGENGGGGLVRMVFLGDLGLSRNLRSYYQATASQLVGETPTIVVPGFNSVPSNTNANIAISDFDGANADLTEGAPPPPPTPPPPPENDVLITLETTDPNALTVTPSGPTAFVGSTTGNQVTLTSVGGLPRNPPSVQLNNCGVADPIISGGPTQWTATFTTPPAGTSCFIRFAPGTVQTGDPPPGEPIE